MKQSAFVILFIGSQLVCIVLHIHKHTLFNQYSYEAQKMQRTKEQLLAQKEELTHTFYSLSDRIHVKEFATKKMNMKPITLSQIKKIRDNCESI